jgi:probable selenium-dependent hydroxylase accessory protein YqeC
MNDPRMTCADVFSKLLSEKELICITGGGGKTTLMFLLAGMLEPPGVITTATTRICLPLPGMTGEVFLNVPENAGWKKAPPRRLGHVTLGSSAKDGKMMGLDPSYVDEIYEGGAARYVIVEGDGARRMPFKFYEPHEPVIPSRTTLQIVVAGAEIFIEPLSADNAFRAELAFGRWGAVMGELVPRDVIIKILESPSEYLRKSPGRVRRALVINKCDLLGGRAAGEIAEGLLSSLRCYDYLILASCEDNVCYEFAELNRNGNPMTGGAGPSPICRE